MNGLLLRSTVFSSHEFRLEFKQDMIFAKGRKRCKEGSEGR